MRSRVDGPLEGTMMMTATYVLTERASQPLQHPRQALEHGWTLTGHGSAFGALKLESLRSRRI